MWYLLYSQQFHFAVHMLAALAFFAAGWLYLDACNKQYKFLIYRITGYFILSIGSLLQATEVEIVIFQFSLLTNPLFHYLNLLLPFAGLALIFLSLSLDPIQKKPVHRLKALFPGVGLVKMFVSLVRPVLSFGVAVMYYIHVAEGLEWHLLAPGLAFLAFSFFEAFNSAISVFQPSQNVVLYHLAQPFGVFWWISHLSLLAGVILLIRWVFWYLLKSFEMQIVIIATSCVMILSIVTATVFSSHLFRSLVSEITTQMTYSAKIFSYDISGKEKEAISDARFMAYDADLVSAIGRKDSADVLAIIQKFSVSRAIRGIMVLTPQGEQITKNDRDDVLKDISMFDPVISRAARGEESSTAVNIPGIISPTIYLAVAVPVNQDSRVIGVVLLISPLDNAFVSGIRKQTGLDGTIFAGDQLSVTSFKNTESLIGIKEINLTVRKKVLLEGDLYEGETSFEGVQYIGTYLPIKDQNDYPVGMVFVGRPLGEVFQITAKALEGTYALAVVLLVLSIFPAIFVARYIISQIQ